MHEVGLMSDALRRASAVAAQAGAHRIQRLTFAITPGSHVTPEIVETLFTVLSAGTPAEGAEVTIECQPARLTCLHCATGFEAETVDALCPTCGGPAMANAEEHDLVLVSIDVHD